MTANLRTCSASFFPPQLMNAPSPFSFLQLLTSTKHSAIAYVKKRYIGKIFLSFKVASAVRRKLERPHRLEHVQHLLPNKNEDNTLPCRVIY